MKNYVLLSFVIIVIVLITSCSFNIKGLYRDYNKLSKKEKELIVYLESTKKICEIKKDNKVYAITGEQLRKCIETRENVMVYSYTPYCTRETCYPLSQYQKYCDSRGIDLFVVANCYDSIIFSEQESLTLPLFSINNKFYKKRFRHKYSELFTRDFLINEDNIDELLWKNQLIFNYGKLVEHSVKIVDDTEGQLKTIEF